MNARIDPRETGSSNSESTGEPTRSAADARIRRFSPSLTSRFGARPKRELEGHEFEGQEFEGQTLAFSGEDEDNDSDEDEDENDVVVFPFFKKNHGKDPPPKLNRDSTRLIAWSEQFMRFGVRCIRSHEV